ncbi:hypothetical protein Ancab_009548 [Ancistrocladus abbreviatus]
MNNIDALDNGVQQSMHRRVETGVGTFGCERSKYPSQLHDASTSSPVDDGCDEGHDKAVLIDVGSAERCLFRAEIVHSGGNPLPWKVASMEIDGWLPNGSLSQQLALGG